MSTDDINAKEIIFTESPLLLVNEQKPLGVFERLVQTGRVTLYEAAALAEFIRTPTEERRKYLELFSPPEDHQIFKNILKGFSEVFKVREEEAKLACRVMAIFRVNGYEIGDDDVVAIFYLRSRFSHSCSPNTLASGAGGFARIRARRDIRAGEELTVTYLSTKMLKQPVQVRRKHLLDEYGFTCYCERCCAEIGVDFVPPPEFALANAADCVERKKRGKRQQVCMPQLERLVRASRPRAAVDNEIKLIRNPSAEMLECAGCTPREYECIKQNLELKRSYDGVCKALRELKEERGRRRACTWTPSDVREVVMYTQALYEGTVHQ